MPKSKSKTPADIVVALGHLLDNGGEHPDLDAVAKSKPPPDVLHLVGAGTGVASLWHWDVRLGGYEQRGREHVMQFATAGKQVVHVTWSSSSSLARLQYTDHDDGTQQSLGLLSGFLQSLADSWDPATEREIPAPKELVEALARVRGSSES